MSKTALSPADFGANVVRRRRGAIIKKARAIQSAALGAADIDDNAPKPEGWTERQYRVAVDNRKSKRNRPGYLDTVDRIVENADKIEAAQFQAAPVQLNIGTIVHVQAIAYPTLLLDKKE